jgi:hypothetical protein
MTISDYLNRKIPEYYDFLFLDGYTPTEILNAQHKYMDNRLTNSQNDTEIKIISEVKKK